jgi:DNA-binding IclR family transcriptional regulator
MQRENAMESENKNYALNLLKALRARAGRGGKLQIDMDEICRAAGLDEMDVKECLTDLEHQGFVRTEITCFIEKQWR